MEWLVDLPLQPLAQTYLAMVGAVADSPKRRNVLIAREKWLHEAFLSSASEDAFRDRLLTYYRDVMPVAFHRRTIAHHARMIRHGINHLLFGFQPLPDRFDHCAAENGAYRVPGVGFSFWSSIVQSSDPAAILTWTPEIERGLRRLRLLPSNDGKTPGQRLRQWIAAGNHLRGTDPRWTIPRLEHFLGLIAVMNGRELGVEPENEPTALPPAFRSPVGRLPDLLRHERTQQPLRRRLKESNSLFDRTRSQVELALSTNDAALLTEALRGWTSPTATDPEEILRVVRRLRNAENVEATLAESWATGGDLSLSTLLLHLQNPQLYPVWDEATRHGLARLDDGYSPSAHPVEGYRLYREAVAEVRDRFRIHPFETGPLLSALARDPESPSERNAAVKFHGFCSDSFRFLAELSLHNDRTWMETQRERYRFVIRDPMIELCRAIAARYIEPILKHEFHWDLETDAKVGRALSSIVKNDYGQTVPYVPEMWITFYRRNQGGKREDVQFFIRLEARGLSYGIHLGRHAREAGKQFRRNVQEHAEPIWRALNARLATTVCRYFVLGSADPIPMTNPGDLRIWASGKSLSAAKFVPAGAAFLRSDELVGDILLTFDRLLPVYLCAAEPEPLPLLRWLGGGESAARPCDAEWFRSSTYLPGSWLERSLGLLDLKRQLILQGVPGTGKTHVAKSLARLLTGDKPENIRLVQFHPAFSYEEFVEGIKARTVENQGRHDVTYPVEDGVLLEFAARAASKPNEPHVLVIDEINRGNLPRIFGELLYLLEYRDQEVRLPYSRRAFRLPSNLYLIGTMNGADRSVASIDQALRRRFSFLEMPPNALVLALWLEANPPKAGEAFGQKVVGLFETLNEKLAIEVGAAYQVGHSYFMIPELDEDRLRVVWDHHVRPLLDEYIGSRGTHFELDALLTGKTRREPSAKPR